MMNLIMIVEKITFIFMNFWSLFFLSDIIMTVTEIQFSNTETSFDTFREIENMNNLKIFSYYDQHEYLTNDFRDPISQNFISKTQVINDSIFYNECILSLSKGDRICIAIIGLFR